MRPFLPDSLSSHTACEKRAFLFCAPEARTDAHHPAEASVECGQIVEAGLKRDGRNRLFRPTKPDRGAMQAGAQEMMPLDDQFWGDRAGGMRDRWGNAWFVATRIEKVDEKELERRLAAGSPQGAGAPA